MRYEFDTSYYERRIDVIAEDASQEIRRAIDHAFKRADERLDALARTMPRYVAPQAVERLQHMTQLALGETLPPGSLVRFRVPSVYCGKPPLLIAALAPNCPSYPMREKDLMEQTRWQVSVDNGHNGTWRDSKGMIGQNGRFVPAEHYHAPDEQEISDVLCDDSWSTHRIELVPTGSDS